MSDALTSTPPPTTATRGAFYLLEGILQRMVEEKSAVKNGKRSKLWSRLHAENKFVAILDGEKVRDNKFGNWINRKYPDVEASRTERNRLTAEFQDQFDDWKDEKVSMIFSDKERDTARDALKDWHTGLDASKNRLMEINENSNSLLTAFGTDE